jgi:hypothetical protein
MPLVRTPMIAPTRIYEQMPTISPEEAAEMVVEAVIRRPQRLATRLGLFAQWLQLLSPAIAEAIMNSAYRMFPENPAAPGQGDVKALAPEAVALSKLLRGVHW